MFLTLHSFPNPRYTSFTRGTMGGGGSRYNTRDDFPVVSTLQHLQQQDCEGGGSDGFEEGGGGVEGVGDEGGSLDVLGGSECGRSVGLASVSDVGDCEEDVFDSSVTEGEKGRGLGRFGRGLHRKWSRASRKSAGDNSKRRDSAVTDKAILSHFASRRHSTFFI